MSGKLGMYESVKFPHESSQVGDGYTGSGKVKHYKLTPEELAKYGPVNEEAAKKNKNHRLDKERLTKLLETRTAGQVAETYKTTTKIILALAEKYGLELDEKNRLKQEKEQGSEPEPEPIPVKKTLPLWISITKNLVMVSAGVVQKLRKDPCKITVRLEGDKIVVKANGKGYKVPERNVAMQCGGKKIAEFLREKGFSGKYDLEEDGEGRLVSVDE